MEYNKDYELLGFIQGDGQLSDMNNHRKLGITINIGENDMDVYNYFDLPDFDKSGRHVYMNNRPDLIDKINKLGFSIEPMHSRIMPLTFNEWERIEKLSFIRGMFSANGSAIGGYCRISYKAINKELLVGIKDFLSTSSIHSYITTNKSKVVEFKNGKYLCSESYDLNINRKSDVQWFYNNIGFIQQYKMDKLYSDLFIKKELSTNVKGIRKNPNIKNKYTIKYKLKESGRSKSILGFDNSVKYLLKKHAKHNIKSNHNPTTNTIQLNYISHDDNLPTFIEVDMEGNIIKFEKQQTF